MGGLRGVAKLTMVLGFGLLPLSQSSGQVVFRGEVRDSGTGAGLSGAEVLIGGAVRATADSLGRFELRLDPAVYSFLIRRIGYAARMVDLDVRGMDTLSLAVDLAQVAHTLEPLEATAPAVLLRGFEERRLMGFGSFVGEDDLRRNEHRSLSDLLRTRAPWLRLTRHGGRVVAMGRSGCPVAVWVDGVRVYAPSAQEASPFRTTPLRNPYDLDQWGVEQLQAVELYTVSEAPAQFQGTGSGCGTLLLWTRRR